MIPSFIDSLRDDSPSYFHLKSLSPVSCRSALRVPDGGGEGSRPGLAGGVGASRGAVYGATDPSQSLLPERRAHPGAERGRPGEGTSLLISSSEAAGGLWRLENV